MDCTKGSSVMAMDPMDPMDLMDLMDDMDDMDDMDNVDKAKPLWSPPCPHDPHFKNQPAETWPYRANRRRACTRPAPTTDNTNAKGHHASGSASGFAGS